jgi:AcrR family transcriptional regulator
MTDKLQTRDRIKIAARRLIAERGVEAVTVREIVTAAGAKNVGSLSYYFESKEGLISELLTDIFREISAGWMEGLSELDKRGGPLGVREVIEVIVRYSDLRYLSDPSPTASRFLASVLFTRRRMVNDLLDRMHFVVFASLLERVASMRRDIPVPVMRQRLIFLAWYFLSALSAVEVDKAQKRRNRVWLDYDPIANLIDTAAGLVEAPISAEGAAGAPLENSGAAG